MIDREKVIEGLNNIKSIINAAVYYDDGYGSEQDLNCLDDAITLLEEQEPRLLTLDEVKTIGTQNYNQIQDENTRLIWIEERNANALRITKPTYYDFFEEEDEEPIIINYVGTDYYDHFKQNTYGKDWRCWSSKPTEEQRKAVKWDD